MYIVKIQCSWHKQIISDHAAYYYYYYYYYVVFYLFTVGGSMWNVTDSSMRINGIVHSSLIAYFAVLKVSQLAWISILSFRICHLKRQLEFKLSVIKLLNSNSRFLKTFYHVYVYYIRALQNFRMTKEQGIFPS